MVSSISSVGSPPYGGQSGKGMQGLATFSVGNETFAFYDVRQALGDARFGRLPFVKRVFAENLLRHLGRPGVSMELIDALADPTVAPDTVALPLHVPRIVLPDSSGI